jgi:hypothetical protein
MPGHPRGPKTLGSRATELVRKLYFELKSAKHGQRQGLQARRRNAQVLGTKAGEVSGGTERTESVFEDRFQLRREGASPADQLS